MCIKLVVSKVNNDIEKVGLVDLSSIERELALENPEKGAKGSCKKRSQ